MESKQITDLRIVEEIYKTRMQRDFDPKEIRPWPQIHFLWNRGLGSIFLKQLAECLQDAACIVGEVEDPDKAGSLEERSVRERRLQFYLRSGYKMTDVISRVFGVDFRVLEVPTSTEHTSGELCRIYSEIYRGIFPPPMFETKFEAAVFS